MVVVLVAVVGCSHTPAPPPYRRPMPESVRLAQEGITDTIRLRRWRTIDSLAASESGDSLAKLYVASLHAPPSEGRMYEYAIRCEKLRIMTRLGGMAGAIVTQRVVDSLNTEPAVRSASAPTMDAYPKHDEHYACDPGPGVVAGDSLDLRPEDFPPPEDRGGQRSP